MKLKIEATAVFKTVFELHTQEKENLLIKITAGTQT